MGVQRYRQMDIETASPEELIVKLYEGAMRHGRLAIDHQHAGRVADRGRALSKAIGIVSELASALDMDRGGDVASNLDALYGFVNDKLLEANLRGEVQPVEDALKVLGILWEAWVEIARNAGRAEILEAVAS